MSAPEYRLGHDIGAADGEHTAHVIAYATAAGPLVILATITHKPGEDCDLCRAAEAGIGSAG